MTIGDKKRQIIITVNRNKNSTGNYYPYDKYNLDEKKKKKKYQQQISMIYKKIFT